MCERILREQDQAVSLIRMVDQVNVEFRQPVPEGVEAIPWEARLAISIQSVGYEGEKEVVLQLVYPDGRIEGFQPLIAHFKGESEIRTAILIVQVTVGLRRNGLYYFDVLFDGALATRIPWLVNMNRELDESDGDLER